MQKIVPHLWFDTQAREAVRWYVSIFGGAIEGDTQIDGTPSGQVDIVNFELAGVKFMAISAGPVFSFNPSISLFVQCESDTEVMSRWEQLSGGGKVLMELGSYPWAHTYGWVQDKYGLSWQLSYSEHGTSQQKITPKLMFTGEHAGKAQAAMNRYVALFPDSHTEMVSHYEAGDGDKEEYIKHSLFSLAGFEMMAMDSSMNHGFTFNEAISLMVSCKDQAEVDHYWNALSAVPESEQCGWLKDEFGVSWQIVPAAMGEMMSTGTPEQLQRVTQAFLKMKKFDVATLQRAFDGAQ